MIITVLEVERLQARQGEFIIFELEKADRFPLLICLLLYLWEYVLKITGRQLTIFEKNNLKPGHFCVFSTPHPLPPFSAPFKLHTRTALHIQCK